MIFSQTGLLKTHHQSHGRCSILQRLRISNHDDLIALILLVGSYRYRVDEFRRVKGYERLQDGNRLFVLGDRPPLFQVQLRHTQQANPLEGTLRASVHLKDQENFLAIILQRRAVPRCVVP